MFVSEIFSNNELLIYPPLYSLVLIVVLTSSSAYDYSTEDFDYDATFGTDHLKCIVDSLSVTTPGEVVSSLRGLHCDNERATSLSIEDQNVIFWPRGLETIFNSLTNILLSNSKLSFVHQLDLKPFENLRELNLSNNDLTILDGNLFEFNRDIESVSFSGNKLIVIGENIVNSLKTLMAADFRDNICTNQHTVYAGIEKLKFDECSVSKLVSKSFQLEKQLNLMKTKFESCDGNLDSSTKLLFESTKLKSIEDEESIPEMIELSCQFDFKETCIVANLCVDSPGLFVNPKLESFKELLGREVTKKLIVIDQKSLFLPDNLASIFMQLTEIEVSTSGLFEIGPKVFNNMTSLTTLNITHNKLRELHSNAFQDLENLLIMDLSDNKIEIIKTDAFHGLKSLHYLNLGNNKLRSISNNFQGLLSSLAFLSLKNNKLKFINANLISPESKFNVLDLTNNDCIDMKHPEQNGLAIQAKIIAECIKPLQLTCSFGNEEITVNDNLSFVGYMCKADDLFIDFPQTKISKLYGVHSGKLSVNDVVGFLALGQAMKFLPAQLAQILPKVGMIMIERSQLTAIQKSDFEGFKLLIKIIIRFNNLSSIDPEAFNSLARLEILDLSNNNIRFIPPRLFTKLVLLTSLNLSFNSLEKLPAELLLRKNKIQHFWLNNNELEIIDIQVMRCLRKAETVDLSSNDCIDMKYEKQKQTKSFAEIFTEVDVSCSPENLNY